MPIPYSEPNSPVTTGTAGFLKFVEENNSIEAALFMISGTGVPLDFSLTKVDVTSSFLWRKGHSKREAITSLIKVLFDGTSRSPDLILVLAKEVPPQIFADDITTQVPLGRISDESYVIQAISEETEPFNESTDVIWSTGSPAEGSIARNLYETLKENGLVLEPFERATIGLEEARNR